MKASEALIAWTPATSVQPTRGRIEIRRYVGEDGHLLPHDWSLPYAELGGAAFVDRRKLGGGASLKRLLAELNTIVNRDGIDPLVAHKAFLAIDEYAAAMPSGSGGGCSKRVG